MDFIVSYIKVNKQMESLKVIKRDGSVVPVSFDEITERIRKLSLGLDHVNPDLVAQKVCSQLEDNMLTSKLDEFAAETAATMQSRHHPNYGYLASRILVSNFHKNTPASLKECVENLPDSVSQDYKTLVNKHHEQYQKMIDYSSDYIFDYFGFKTLERAYLMKNERPQHLWMRVAIQLHGSNFPKVKETYDALSLGFFIHATPTLFNSGTKKPQLSSCFLQKMKDDSIKGIYETLADCAQISKWAGGIGLNIHNVRGRGSKINGTQGESTGIVPMLKVFNDTAKYVNQGGKRNGSFAIYLEPWHSDIEDFLRLKLNQGAEEERARDLFYALWIPDLFMKRVEEDAHWTLMCPSECPGLADCYGSEFEEKYIDYECQKKGKKVRATDIWKLVMDSQIQTGMPYLCYKDAANSKSNQQNLGVIKSSNLCAEIIEYSSSDETAVCNLGSLALPKFIVDGVFNFGLLRKYTKILAKNLDILIDKNYYPTPECAKSNFRNRPIGIGVQGLADVFAILRLSWTSEQARKLNREIFEHIYYAALEASIERCQDMTEYQHLGLSEPGWYPSFQGSPMSIGVLQFDMWNEKPITDLDWKTLKTKAQKGVRNSLMVALMPTASTSQILGNNECFEPFTSNIYSRRVLAGDFIVINKYLVKDLVERDLWTTDVRTQIIANNGSIQSLECIPSDLKGLYKTVWEIPQKVLIDMSRDRAPFICQSQSLNLFSSEPSYSKLTSMHFYAWKSGLKTGCYYLRTRGIASAQKFTVEPCLTCSS
jgi:ribonucleoside-diphosphate reductase alpha chain